MEKKINNVSDLNLENDCCGCSSCRNICPVHAIEMQNSHDGFYIPVVDPAKCINCGLCLKACQICTEPKKKEPDAVYAMAHKDQKIRFVSSSGGLFLSICECLYEVYGNRLHCFGAVWDKDLSVVHKEANTFEECKDFSGSKYVQSKLENTFGRIAELLLNHDMVLFSGTGCQCAGLKNFLKLKKISTENLVLLDLVCHGVPSPKVWRDYLKCLGERYHSPVVSYTFRDKSKGWGMYPVAVTESGEVIPKSPFFMSYAKMFHNLILNNSCYNCKYASTARVGDITLGDFWGIEKTTCEFNDGMGVSLCLVNSSKGQEIAEMLKKSISHMLITEDIYKQPQLCRPSPKNTLATQFWQDYRKFGYEYVSKKYTENTKFQRICMKIKARLLGKLR